MSRSITLATEAIRARVENGVGWLEFNSPARRNAVSLAMWQGIADAITAFCADASVRVVVMYGAGGQAFASGADISEFDAVRANAEQRRSYGEIAERGQRALATLEIPLVAMITGFCIGGGLGIALAADVRFATPESRFAIPAARLGLGYEYGGVAALARLVGPSVARDILFSARQLDAAEAEQVGLVNFVVGAEQIDARVREYCARIAANAPLTVRAAKAAVATFERYSRSDPAEVAEVTRLVDACFDSEDYKEGRRAFAEKRKPEFRGQ